MRGAGEHNPEQQDSAWLVSEAPAAEDRDLSGAMRASGPFYQVGAPEAVNDEVEDLQEMCGATSWGQHQHAPRHDEEALPLFAAAEALQTKPCHRHEGSGAQHAGATSHKLANPSPCEHLEEEPPSKLDTADREKAAAEVMWAQGRAQVRSLAEAQFVYSAARLQPLHSNGRQKEASSTSPSSMRVSSLPWNQARAPSSSSSSRNPRWLPAHLPLKNCACVRQGASRVFEHGDADGGLGLQILVCKKQNL